MQLNESNRDYPWSKEHQYGDWIVLCPASWHGGADNGNADADIESQQEDEAQEEDNAEEKADDKAGGRPAYDPRNRKPQEDSEEIRALKERIRRGQEEDGSASSDAEEEEA